MALSEYYRIHRSSLSIRFSGINAVVCFYFFLVFFYKICVIQHKNPPTDETVGGYAAGRSPCNSFKSSDIICDTGKKITRLRITIGGLSARTPRLSVLNALDILKTPDSEAEKYPASGKPETGFTARRRGLSLSNALDYYKTCMIRHKNRPQMKL